ncbi:cilia- and flagella-associated protein 141-like [Sycon ciliatum]|uniref:cilia- and flagella-associated protein 141-like n=1 Tax=Sycon ciliatum TaxID=27933 RepID=UPI0020A9C361|eukprot:scpid92386/ scgid11503/ 
MEASRSRSSAAVAGQQQQGTATAAGLTSKHATGPVLRTVDLSGQRRQAARIKYDEEMAAREKDIRNMEISNMISNWSSSLDERSHSKTARRHESTKKEEMRLAGHELTALRKTQMKELFAREEEQYRREFEERGVTFYKERI